MIYVLISALTLAIIGTLAHFLYDFTEHNRFIGLFAAVNESTWEHVKIALTPILLWSLYDGFIYGQNTNYFLAKLASLLTPILIIPTIFYGYKAILKKRILAIDIMSFFITVFLSQLFFWLILNLPAMPYVVQYLSILGVFIVFGAYAVLTLFPLRFWLFKDPITKKYGFPAHSDKYNPFKKKK